MISECWEIYKLFTNTYIQNFIYIYIYEIITGSTTLVSNLHLIILLVKLYANIVDIFVDVSLIIPMWVQVHTKYNSPYKVY